jgi:hypothetical protein
MPDAEDPLGDGQGTPETGLCRRIPGFEVAIPQKLQQTSSLCVLLTEYGFSETHSVFDRL